MEWEEKVGVDRTTVRCLPLTSILAINLTSEIVKERFVSFYFSLRRKTATASHSVQILFAVINLSNRERGRRRLNESGVE